MKTRALDLLLGSERKQRLRLARSLGADGVFAVCLMFQWRAVTLGMTDRPTGGARFVVVRDCLCDWVLCQFSSRVESALE